MNQLENDLKWLRRGGQRSALAQVLRKPMTATELCVAARLLSPRVQLRDIWFLMKQFEARGLVVSLNHRAKTGRLFCLTDQGRRVVEHGFGIRIKPIARRVNWRTYSLVVRAKTRKLTLLGLANLTEARDSMVSATELRKALREEYPVGLNPVIRALKELLNHRLVAIAGKKNSGRNAYRLTRAGRKIVEQLLA